MQYAVLDLLGTALIPELSTDISTGSSGNVHLVLIQVSAVGASPDEFAVFVADDLDLAVKATHLAIVALGVKFGVHDVIVDEAHNVHNSIQVVLHIGHLDVTDGTAGRQSLEFGFQSQLAINIFL